MPTELFTESSLKFPAVGLCVQQNSLNFPTSWVQQNTHQPIIRYQAGNMSPGMGSSSSTSSVHENENSNSLSPVYSPDTTTDDIIVGEKPCLVIVDEPAEKFRFRYKTEMHGTHGAILACSYPNKGNHKTFPKVKLCKYKAKRGETVVIRCSLFTVDRQQRGPHVHRLVAKRTNGEEEDPHDEVVNSTNKFTAVFEHMTILFTKKEEQDEVLLSKMKRQVDRMIITPSARNKIPTNHPLRKQLENILDEDNVEELLEHVSSTLKDMNRNQACLRFDALVDRGRGYYESLCEPVYSRPILNMKNPETNPLKIVRISHVCGSVEGRQEVFIFIEKVQSKNIKVRFFETNDKDVEIWNAYADFKESDVHHQYGIVFKTPPYHDQDIDEDKEVWFQLERPKDGQVSPPHVYTYRCISERLRRRKIPRRASAETNLPTTLPGASYQPVIVRPEDNPLEWDQMDQLLKELGTDDFTKYDSSNLFPNINFAQEPSQTEETLSSLNSTIPSANSEMLEAFCKEDRFMEWAQLHGGETAAIAEQYLSGEMDGLKLSMNIDNADDASLILDGSSVQSECLLPAKTQKNSPRQRLNQRLNSSKKENVQKPTKLGARKGKQKDKNGNKDGWEFQMEGYVSDIPETQMDMGEGPRRRKSEDRSQSRPMTESNIIKSTDRTIINLVNLEKSRKIAKPQLHDCLKRLFEYTVGDNDDNVFHVMASSGDFCPEVVNITTVLRQYDLCNRFLNYKNKEEETPLIVAIRKGVAEMVGMFLESGADVNATDMKKNTTLHLAVANQDLDKIVYVLLKKPVVTCLNEDGLTALHLALLRKNSRVISQLLTKMEDGYRPSELINIQERKQGDTALHIAARDGFIEGVALLLNLGTNIKVDIKNHADKTPLALVYWKTDERSNDIKKLLLAAKANPSLVDIEEDDEYEDVEIKEEMIDDTTEDNDEDKYAGEWDDEQLFDKDTVSRLCCELDQDNMWRDLARRLAFRDNEMDYCSVHWSPSLMLFKVAALYHGGRITAKLVRDQLEKMSGLGPVCAEYINEMLRQRRKCRDKDHSNQ